MSVASETPRSSGKALVTELVRQEENRCFAHTPVVIIVLVVVAAIAFVDKFVVGLGCVLLLIASASRLKLQSCLIILAFHRGFFRLSFVNIAVWLLLHHLVSCVLDELLHHMLLGHDVPTLNTVQL